MNVMSEVMSNLYHAGKNHMSPRELRKMGMSLCDAAEQRAAHMRDGVSGIASLVQRDGGIEAGAGNFQDADEVFTLLVTLAHEFDSLAGMIAVGHDAILTAGSRAHHEELVDALKSAGVGIVQQGPESGGPAR